MFNFPSLILLLIKLVKLDGLRTTEIFFNSCISNWFKTKFIFLILGSDLISDKKSMYTLILFVGILILR